MKTLFLIRHAKSDWTHEVEDFQRPLNERGHQNARGMAKFLLESGFEIDSFVSSPAKRALTTCRYFAETFGNSAIKKVEDLYEPLLEDFYKTIERTSDEFNSIALFSHNPTISEFLSDLVSESREFSTCTVAIVKTYCESWSEFSGAEKTLTHFLLPKEILD
ncbi:SixA phosphatase family protein [Chryseobacterium sp. A321]